MEIMISSYASATRVLILSRDALKSSSTVQSDGEALSCTYSCRNVCQRWAADGKLSSFPAKIHAYMESVSTRDPGLRCRMVPYSYRNICQLWAGGRSSCPSKIHAYMETVLSRDPDQVLLKLNFQIFKRADNYLHWQVPRISLSGQGGVGLLAAQLPRPLDSNNRSLKIRCNGTIESLAPRSRATLRLKLPAMTTLAVSSGPTDEYIYESNIPPFKFPQDKTLPEFVLEGVESYLDKVAIVDSSDERQYTYGQVQTLVRNVTAGLIELDIRKGDVVCIVLPNTAEYFLLVFGIMSAGGVFSGVNPYAHPNEIAKQVHDSEAKLVITDPTAVVKMTDIKVPILIVGGEAPAGTIPGQVLFEADGSKVPKVDISPDDLCALPYSSGTTGLSKGVMLTHRSLVCNLCQTLCQVDGKFSHELVAQDRNRTVLGLMPMFHIYGICGLGCGTLRMKGTVVVMERYEIRRFLEILIKYQVTFAPLVPPIILQLVKNPVADEFDLSKLKLESIMCAAAPLSSELQKAFETKFPAIHILQAYGLTEFSCITLSHTALYNREPSKKGSVGYILPGTKLKFVDLSSGKTVPPNTLGELYAKGPMVMKGYYKNPEATKNTVDEEGWLHTGDIGYIDDDGDVFIVERVKELIKYKGFQGGGLCTTAQSVETYGSNLGEAGNSDSVLTLRFNAPNFLVHVQVPPAELEAILIAHPAINDAAVVGIPDEEAGEIPAACIVLKPNTYITEREIKEYVADKVANYKKLRVVQLVSSIPKSLSGKILRRVVKDTILQEFEAREQVIQAAAN